MNGRIWLVLGALGSLTACDAAGINEVTCSDEAAQEVAKSLVSTSIQEILSDKYLSSEDGVAEVPKAKIRAAIAELKMSLEQIRTSKEDPNSTQKFCLATLTIAFPPEIVADADEANKTISYSSVAELADGHDLERRANAFSSEIAYNVQPTDDRSDIFVEIEDANLGIFDFSADVISSHLMRARYDAQQAQSRMQERQQQEAEESAYAEQAQANLASAKAEMTLSEQSINAVWESLSSERRDELLPVQRAWIQKKSADCKIEAASESIDPNERRAAQMRCEMRYNLERGRWLEQFREYDYN